MTQVRFVVIGHHWFSIDDRLRQTVRLDATTGAVLWTYADSLPVATVTEGAVSFYKKINDDVWQVTAIDLATGAVIFDQRLQKLARHIVKGVLARDGWVFVEFGAQYDWDLARGAKYRTYSVAFDAKRRTIEGQAHDVSPAAIVPVLIEFFQ